MGNRIGKSNFDGTNTNSTWYIKDASGNNMATYNRYNDQGLYIDEFNIYGSSRLGTFKPHWHYPVTSKSPSSAYSKYFAYPSGYKQYELTNHLGNVLSTISDQKTPVNDDSDPEPDYFTAIVKSQQDYYPFGMMMPARTYSLGGDYRYGFNGMEKDDEVKGRGNSYDFGARLYDSRLGRFLSVDRMYYLSPDITPYRFGFNSPIAVYDPDGNYEADGSLTKGQTKAIKKESKAEAKSLKAQGQDVGWRKLRDEKTEHQKTENVTQIDKMVSDSKQKLDNSEIANEAFRKLTGSMDDENRFNDFFEKNNRGPKISLNDSENSATDIYSGNISSGITSDDHSLLHEYIHYARIKGFVYGDTDKEGYKNLTIGDLPISPEMQRDVIVEAFQIRKSQAPILTLKEWNVFYKGYISDKNGKLKGKAVEGGYLFEKYGLGKIK
jgi:RHS repeat-associated protein